MSNFVDLTGQKFNRLTVRNYFGRSKSRCSLWLCDCECGGTAVVRTADLRNGHTKSCGCLFIETSISKLPTDVNGEKTQTTNTEEQGPGSIAFGATSRVGATTRIGRTTNGTGRKAL